jgi:hypothetical protein
MRLPQQVRSLLVEVQQEAVQPVARQQHRRGVKSVEQVADARLGCGGRQRESRWSIG